MNDPVRHKIELVVYNAQLSQAEQDAVTYLSLWGLGGYNYLWLTQGAGGDFSAAYYKEEATRGEGRCDYFIAGIKNQSTGKYSFHS